MKHITFLLCAMLPALMWGQDWNNLEVLSRNKVAPHVLRMDSHPEWTRCLDGEWDFYFSEKPETFENLENFESFRIKVPGNMELQGFGVPVYVNVANEFKSNPPYAPTEYNPTGLYVRKFEIDSAWLARRTFLKIGAVKSCCHVYCNGREVGYSQDSKTPAEFELTRYLKAGRNELRVRVQRFSDGSYLECQDMWRMSGITRSVELYSLPRTYIKDFRVRAMLDTATYSQGLLDLTVDYSEELRHATTIAVELLDASGASLMRREKEVELEDWYTFFNIPVGGVQPWSPERPYLYTLVLRLDSTHEVRSQVGFRNVEMKTLGGVQQLCLNGRPLVVKGVNRHEHSGFTGHYVSPAEMREDIRLMKEMNVNAVRTSHYPCDELWYDLCDSAGLLVWDEANVESHAQGYGAASLAKNPDWEEAILDRVNNMYQRDKNHPCVFVWSLGNECGNGVCFESAYRFLKGKDKSRPVSYERAELDWNTDIVGIMYPSVDYLSWYAREKKNTRPYIMVEYCHAMGNSLGGLSDYWDTIRRYPILQGGFIWDWVDQSIVQTDEKGRKWYAVGGDLGTIPDCGDDDAFCANGLINSDRIPHEHYYHAKEVYRRRHTYPDGLRPFCLPLTDQQQAKVRNRKGIITITGEDYTARFNTVTAEMESYVLQGKEQFVTPMRPNFWRPPTLNDLADRNGARAWQGLDQLRYELVECKVKGNEADMLYRVVAPDGQAMMLRYIITARSQSIQLSFRLEPQGAFKTLPKMGLQMGVLADSVFWYGPEAENYPDRCHGYPGYRNKPVSDLIGEMHLVPQESGNHQGFRVELGNISFIPVSKYSPDLNFSLRQYADSTLTRCRRIKDLPDPLPYYILNIDYLQAGLGSATCGPGTRPKYLISGDSVYTYSFFLGTPPVTTINPYPEALVKPLPSLRKSSPISEIRCDKQPVERYGKNFPQMLFDGKRAVPGDYSEGWAGFLGEECIELEITLQQPTNLESLTLGVCNAPGDWVLAPSQVEVFIDNQWHPLSYQAYAEDRNATLSNPNASPDRTRLRYRYQGRHKKVKSLTLRILPQSLLPAGHPYHGEKAWLMIDEIEIQ